MKTKKELATQSGYSFADLRDIVAALRAPDGCPWDKEQTHESIRRNFLEEAYEAVECIDKNDMPHLREELGDVLLQVLLHAQMESETGSFTIDDVCDELSKKLVYRHPHVFGDVKAANSEDVLTVWDAAKAASRGQTTAAEEMESVSKALPALIAAHKIGKKGRKAGFDFAAFGDAIAKVREELDELESAVESGNGNAHEELGDVYLSLTCAARLIDEDSESALQDANAKFIRRFAEMERCASERETPIASLTDAEKIQLWNIAKENTVE